MLLLDEPLSNLDAKLRVQMRRELRELQQRLGITTIFVTHDQEEAMTICDRIAVMDQGVIQQVGTPIELYDNPANRFVASFVGSANILDGMTATASSRSRAGRNCHAGGVPVPAAPSWCSGRSTRPCHGRRRHLARPGHATRIPGRHRALRRAHGGSEILVDAAFHAGS